VCARSRAAARSCRHPSRVRHGAPSTTRRKPCRTRARSHPCRRDRLAAHAAPLPVPGRCPTRVHCPPTRARRSSRIAAPAGPTSRFWGGGVRAGRTYRYSCRSSWSCEKWLVISFVEFEQIFRLAGANLTCRILECDLRAFLNKTHARIAPLAEYVDGLIDL